MFVVVPLGTDAPIYHFPWMTITLGVVNIVAFFLTGGGHYIEKEAWMPWVLQLGNGTINPIQWVTMNFVHFGILHLLGNLIFLWGFGILVEGKIGWWKFLLVYLAIGTAGGALIQGFCFFIPGLNTQAAGASLILFGLLAISLVWAPKNEVSFFYMVGFYFGLSEISIMVFGFYYIAEQIMIAVFLLSILGFGFAMFLLSQAGHLLGASLGFAIAALMLKWKMVDCENWDLFAVWKGTYGASDEFAKYRNTGFLYPSLGEDKPEEKEDKNESKRKKKRKTSVTASFEMPPEEEDNYEAEVYSRKKDSREFKLIKRLKSNLKIGDSDAVLQVYKKIRQLEPNWQFENQDLKRLIDLLCQYEDWVKAIPFMETYLKTTPGNNAGTRIKLAALLIEVYERPRRSLSILKPLKNAPLKKNQKIFYNRILKIAREKIEDGVVEFDKESLEDE
jgi:membrane associated rhomboid family serine protease